MNFEWEEKNDLKFIEDHSEGGLWGMSNLTGKFFERLIF